MPLLLAALALVLGLTAATPASADDRHQIEAVMSGYWVAYSNADFLEAARYLHPSDREALRVELLPVFLAGVDHPHPELQEIAETFFMGVAEHDRGAMGPEEVFRGLSYIVAAINPTLFEYFRESRLAVDEVQFGLEKKATVHYRVLIRGVPMTDSERLDWSDGAWYIRVKEPAEDTATKFRLVFGLEGSDR
jgi:hypothetical protein